MYIDNQYKQGLQHITEVWYGGSYTNKHDTLTDAPHASALQCHIRLIRSSMPRRTKQKGLRLLLDPYLDGTVNQYGQPCHDG